MELKHIILVATVLAGVLVVYRFWPRRKRPEFDQWADTSEFLDSQNTWAKPEDDVFIPKPDLPVGTVISREEFCEYSFRQWPWSRIQSFTGLSKVTEKILSRNDFGPDKLAVTIEHRTSRNRKSPRLVSPTGDYLVDATRSELSATAQDDSVCSEEDHDNILSLYGHLGMDNPVNIIRGRSVQLGERIELDHDLVASYLSADGESAAVLEAWIELKGLHGTAAVFEYFFRRKANDNADQQFRGEECRTFLFICTETGLDLGGSTWSQVRVKGSGRRQLTMQVVLRERTEEPGAVQAPA